MRVSVNWSALGSTGWHEYAVRFVFGGAMTVIAGVVATRFGPGIGGLFLAFPAIFPASATLVERHERDKKRKAGLLVSKRGRKAAALDARGAALGSLGLCCFASAVWLLLPTRGMALVLLTATAAWTIVTILLWRLRKSSLWP